MKLNDKDNLEAIKRLLILQLRYQDVPVELIEKASGMKAKTIQNQFPSKKKNRKGDKDEKE